MGEDQSTGAASDVLGFRAFADLLGCSPGYVTELRKRGRLVLTDDGRKVRVAASQQRIAATASPDRAAVAQRHAQARGGALGAQAQPPPMAAPDNDGMISPQPAPSGADGDKYQRARAAREQYAAATAKLDYEERIGKLVAASEVVAVAAEVGAAVRRRLESLPHIIAAQVEERERARIHALATDLVEQVLTDLERGLARATTSSVAN